LENKEHIKQKIHKYANNIINTYLESHNKYKWLRERPGIFTEGNINTQKDSWYWHRYRWGILEDQYLLRFNFDKNSLKIRLHNNINEWISKKHIPIDDELEPLHTRNENYTDQDVNKAIAHIHSESEENNASDISSQEANNTSDIKLYDTDSDSEGGEPEEDNDKIRKHIRRHITEGKEVTIRSVCWACGKEDSMHHLLWECTKLSIIHKSVEIMDQYTKAKLEDQTKNIVTPNIQDWWMSWKRSQDERNTFGKYIRETFKNREQWCVDNEFRPTNKEQMYQYEITVQYLHSFRVDPND
jgi:hypothetical protein